MQKVINFSGGLTSAYMTIKEYLPGDLVIFCDTGREHPKTYKFINDFEAFENIPIIRLKYYDSENPFQELLQRRKYKVIPNRVKRICTVELKIKTTKRYLRSIGIQKFINLIGFRADEQNRVLKRKQYYKKVIDTFPLYDQGITKQDVNHYWSSKSYTLEIPSILGNCTLCFMKGVNAIIAILSVYPELADPWIEDEKKAAIQCGTQKVGNGRLYFPGVSIQQLKNIAQNNLFKNYDLVKIEPAYKCGCTN